MMIKVNFVSQEDFIKMKNKIILTAETELEDIGARNYLSILNTKVDTINERTKQHTKDIMELRRMIKEKK